MAAPFGKSVTKHGGPGTFSQSELEAGELRRVCELPCVSFECDSLSAEMWREKGKEVAGSTKLNWWLFLAKGFWKLGQEWLVFNYT